MIDILNKELSKFKEQFINFKISMGLSQWDMFKF